MTLSEIQQQVTQNNQLQIVGSSPLTASGTVLDMSKYSGVIEYFPAELIMTVKAGTRLAEIEQHLAKQGQGLPFTALNSDTMTIGGVYAVGSPKFRDAVLGVKIIDGQGRILAFGGQVIKNVAGYDVARLLVGSQGQLAVICDISFKVLPQAYINHSGQNHADKSTAKSAVITQLEQGLKAIFDPNSVFI